MILTKSVFWPYGFCMALAESSNAVSRLARLRSSGVVRSASTPAVASRIVAAGDPIYRDLLPSGGFPTGYISEIRGDRSSGCLTLAVRSLLRSLAAAERSALVTSLEFFPGLTPNLASALSGLLVCRMRSLEAGLGAAEVLTTAGAVDLLVVDVVGLCSKNESRVSPSSIARIERAARAEQIAIVVLTNAATANAIGLGSKAAIRIETESAKIGAPDGALCPRLTLTRSRFAPVRSMERPSGQGRAVRR